MKNTINLISEAVDHGTECGVDLFMRSIVKDLEKQEVFESVDKYDLFEHIASEVDGDVMTEGAEGEYSADEEAMLDDMLADLEGDE